MYTCGPAEGAKCDIPPRRLGGGGEGGTSHRKGSPEDVEKLDFSQRQITLFFGPKSINLAE